MNRMARVNEEITDSRIRLILENGKLYGDISLEESFLLASEKKLDIIEVSPARNGELSICKLMDYGKIQYKKAKQKKQHKTVTKEIRFHFNIADHDLKTKNKKILNLLSKNKNVKLVLELRGRERSMIKAAINKMEINLENFSHISSWQRINVGEGNGTISVMLIPVV